MRRAGAQLRFESYKKDRMTYVNLSRFDSFLAIFQA